MADVSLSKEKKKRKMNFTVSEINILMNKVEDNLEVLQSKLTNSITNKRKNAIWEAITNEINAAGVANRTAYEVKGKWKKLTSSAKKRFADIKAQERRTGGGPPPKDASPTEKRIIKLFEDTPLFTGLDGFETEDVVVNTEIVTTSPSQNDEYDVDDLYRPIPPSVLLDEDEDELSDIPPSLPMPRTLLPSLPGPNMFEKRKRVSSQDILQLQAEVLTLHEEVLLLKKQKLEFEIRKGKE